MRTTILKTPPQPSKWRRIFQRTWNRMPAALVILAIWAVIGHPEYALAFIHLGASAAIMLCISGLLVYLEETFEIHRKDERD